MPVNATIEFKKAEDTYFKAVTVEEKIKALQLMLSTSPTHKGSEKLRQKIKTDLAKCKKLQEREKSAKKGSKQKFSIKKEGAALICIVGPTNSGKSTLLNKLTNAKVEIASYEFTTKKPEIGILNYYGVKLQIVEIPAIVPNFIETENGAALMSILNNSDLLIYCFNTPKEKDLLDKELSELDKPVLIFDKFENFSDKIWNKLDLIKVYTKEPGKEKSYPPIALNKNSSVKNLALHVHKDFIKKYKTWARVWGKSVKFQGSQCGLTHILQDDDIVELHIK